MTLNALNLSITTIYTAKDARENYVRGRLSTGLASGIREYYVIDACRETYKIKYLKVYQLSLHS